MIAFGCRLMTILWMVLAGSGAMAAETHIAPRLIAESVEPAAGSATTLALQMQPDPTWHGYWQNPGDAGVETLIDWKLPPGARVGPLRYPIPQTLLLAGLMNYVYEGEYAHLVTLRIPAGLAPGTALPIRAHVRWLACTREVCVPEEGDVAIDLVIGAGTPDRARTADFTRWRAALPKPLGGTARFAIAGGKFRMAVPLPNAMTVKDPYFFALTQNALNYAAPQTITRNGDALIVETTAPPGTMTPDKVSGVLRIGENQGLAIDAVKGGVPAAGTPIDDAAAAGGGSGSARTILLALGGAILGGLLLNIMPCVFPILSLKALSLAKASGDERSARADALAYTAGAVLMCGALGGVLLALRASGAAAGWAFQLQDPRVILVLLLLVAAIALNLAGLFELPAVDGGAALASRRGAAGSFWTGALAAFIATPCTGPFMGAALGAALVLPPAASLAIFAGLGLGLALPFLLLGFVPAMRRLLPRPGAWMNMFRHILALPMFVTAIGLAWILGKLAGVDGMTLGLAAALLIALGLWWVGRRQARGTGQPWWPIAPAIALAIGATVLLLPSKSADVRAETAGGMLHAEPFSEARLAALRATDRPVFVYFTADWCLTCKVNERIAIDRSEVAAAFKAHGVAVLVGDWTRSDPAIGKFLAAQGRSGVPLYLFYKPRQEAETLPQVLTPGMLVALAG